MSIGRRRTRRLSGTTVLITLVALLLAGVMPATAAVAGTTFAVNIILGDRTVQGAFAGDGDAMSVKQKRDGRLIASASGLADGDGRFDLKVKPILAGDTLAITQAGITRSIVVPDLRLSIDTAKDILSGRVPKDRRDLTLGVALQVGSYTLPRGSYHAAVTADPDGTFSVDTTPERDIQGGEIAELSWSGPLDDVFRVLSAGPSVTVQVGRSTVEVYGKRGTTATVTLRSAKGDLRGTASVRIPVTGRPAVGTFRRNGSKVAPRGSDRVTHSAAPKTVFKVRTPDLVLTTPDGGAINATCFPGGAYVLGNVLGTGAFNYLADGFTPGPFAVADITGLGTTLPSGYRVLLICEDIRGYAQTFPASVP